MGLHRCCSNSPALTLRNLPWWSRQYASQIPLRSWITAPSSGYRAGLRKSRRDGGAPRRRPEPPGQGSCSYRPACSSGASDSHRASTRITRASRAATHHRRLPTTLAAPPRFSWPRCTALAGWAHQPSGRLLVETMFSELRGRWKMGLPGACFASVEDQDWLLQEHQSAQ